MNKEIEELVIRFDEMGYEPTTLCPDIAYEINDFRNSLIELDRKQVWHKVADGDLPKESGLYYCVCHYPAISGTFYDIIHSYDFCGYDVVAWTELPKYEGETK